MPTRTFFKLFYALLVCMLYQNPTSAIPPRNKLKKSPSASSLEEVKKEVIETEKDVVEELKAFLKKGTMPSLNFNEWVDAHGQILSDSCKEPIKKLGETLQNIRSGKTTQVNPFTVLSTFENAIQTYDEKFSIDFFSKPGIIAHGTYWYFSSSKK